MYQDKKIWPIPRKKLIETTPEETQTLDLLEKDFNSTRKTRGKKAN